MTSMLGEARLLVNDLRLTNTSVASGSSVLLSSGDKIGESDVLKMGDSDAGDKPVGRAAGGVFRFEPPLCVLAAALK